MAAFPLHLVGHLIRWCQVTRQREDLQVFWVRPQPHTHAATMALDGRLTISAATVRTVNSAGRIKTKYSLKSVMGSLRFLLDS